MRLCTDLGLKEASDYSAELRKLEHAQNEGARANGGTANGLFFLVEWTLHRIELIDLDYVPLFKGRAHEDRRGGAHRPAERANQLRRRPSRNRSIFIIHSRLLLVIYIFIYIEREKKEAYILSGLTVDVKKRKIQPVEINKYLLKEFL